jgi:hypothetical protein
VRLAAELVVDAPRQVVGGSALCVGACEAFAERGEALDLGKRVYHRLQYRVRGVRLRRIRE